VAGEQFRPKNVAAVLATAVLPPFGRSGSQIDVTVSAIGDSKSLLGGTLIMTPLNAADGQIYAVAQGAVISGGVVAEGDAETATQGVPTSGIVPSGARIEREIAFSLETNNIITLALRVPDFTTASRIEAAINRYFQLRIATMKDSGTVVINTDIANLKSNAHIISELENITVSPSNKARVVVDHRSGTIVMGANVTISNVAVAQGNLTLSVEEQPAVISPNPFFPDVEAITVPRSNVEIENNDNTDGIALIEREMDAVLGGFSKTELQDLDGIQFNQFLEILNEDDTQIFNWLVLDERSPEKYNQVIEALKIYCKNVSQDTD